MPTRIRLTKIASLIEGLDVIATEIEKQDPRIALAIDIISDRLSGRTARIVDRIRGGSVIIG
jgi:hypothetical protein